MTHFSLHCIVGRLDINGFTGSGIKPLCYSLPPVRPGQLEASYADYAKRSKPILAEFQKLGVKFPLTCTQRKSPSILRSAERALKAGNYHLVLGFNYDPSHLGYQGVDYVGLIWKFHNRLFHEHMKDIARGLGSEAGVFGGHSDFHQLTRYWDFKRSGRSCINFEKIIRSLYAIRYMGWLCIEWEDGGMDCAFGAAESCSFTRKLTLFTNGAVSSTKRDFWLHHLVLFLCSQLGRHSSHKPSKTDRDNSYYLRSMVKKIFLPN